MRKKLFLPRKYPFQPRRIALSEQNGRITQRSRSRDMRICYGAAQHACKGILPRFLALAHSCVGTERLFSHGRVFRAICDISSGFATTPSCFVRANAHYTRVRICARCGAPDHVGATAFTLRKTRRTFLFPKLKKRARPLYFVKKASPCRFRRHGVFSGTAFCRRNEIRPSFRVFYREIRISIRARRRKRLYLPLFRALPCASSLSPVYDRVLKNTRRFRALSAFEKSSLTSAHI